MSIQMTSSCRTCWWREGPRCYCEKRVGFAREPDPSGIGSRSTLFCLEKSCEFYESKRSTLGKFFPNDMLIITSEEHIKREN